MNPQLEAAQIERRLATGDLLEIAVAVNDRGSVTTYGATSKVFLRMSENETWMGRNFVGVYQWGASKTDIERDIIDTLDAVKPKTGAASVASPGADKKPSKAKKASAYPKRKPRKRLINDERESELRKAIKRREEMRARIEQEYSDKALMARFGVCRSTLSRAKKKLAMSAA